MCKKLYIRNHNVYNNIISKKKQYEMRINKGFIKTLKKNNIITLTYKNKCTFVKIKDLLYFKNIFFLVSEFDICKIIPDCNNYYDFILKYFEYYKNDINKEIVLIKIEII